MNSQVVLLVLVSALLHAAWNFATRRAKGNLVAVWISLALSGVICLPLAIASGWGELNRMIVFYVLATCVANAFYYTLLAKAYEGGDISLVYPISRGGGVAGTAVLALALSIDRIEFLAGVGIAAICVGAVLISRGHVNRGKHSTLQSVLLAMALGVTTASYSIVDKLAIGSVNPLAYICAMYIVTPLLMTPYILATCRSEIVPAIQRHKPFILTVGPASALAYLLILYAYRMGPVSYIAAFREFAVVIGSVMGFLFLGEKVTIRKVVGIAAVAAGLMLVKIA